MATDDLELVAHTVAVGVVDAVSIAVVAGYSVVARSSIGSSCIVVASGVILATDDLELVAHAVTVGVVEAVAVAVVAGFSIVASSRICC